MDGLDSDSRYPHSLYVERAVLVFFFSTPNRARSFPLFFFFPSSVRSLLLLFFFFFLERRSRPEFGSQYRSKHLASQLETRCGFRIGASLAFIHMRILYLPFLGRSRLCSSKFLTLPEVDDATSAAASGKGIGRFLLLAFSHAATETLARIGGWLPLFFFLSRFATMCPWPAVSPYDGRASLDGGTAAP